MSQNDAVTYFGVTDFRNKRTKFGIKRSDRSRHMYIIGKTGMGKSTLLENMAAQDILNGEGMCFVDPHGSAIDTLLDYVPESRINDVVYFAPFDTNYPISFNVMEDVGADSRHLVVNGLMASFKKIWQDAWSARMEYILTNTLLALLEYPDATLLGVNRMLAEKDYRNEVLSKVTDASVKSFWIEEFGKWDPRYAREAAAAIQNKIGQFTANPLIRNIIGQPRSTFDIRKLMDGQKILLVNLSKGRIGEQNAKLLGGMLITKIYLAAMSRADVGGAMLKNLPDFFFYVDEFQNFATESFADILSEARKYKLSLTIAHQYVAQMQEEVKDAVVGNVGTMITFRIGADDAELFEKQFAPVFTAEDIVNLGKFQIYLSLMIDGIGSKPFSALSLAPVERPKISYLQQVIGASRLQYARERPLVEADINAWFEPLTKPERRVIADAKDGSLTQTLRGNTITSKQVSTSAKQDQTTNQRKQESFIVDDNKKTATALLDDELFGSDAEAEMQHVVSGKLSTLLDSMMTKQPSASTPSTLAGISKRQPTITRISKDNTANDNIGKYGVNKKHVSQQQQQPPKPSVDAIVSKKTPQKSERGTQQDTRSTLKDLLSKVVTANNVVTKKVSLLSGGTNKETELPKQEVGKQQATSSEVPEDILRDILN